MPFKSIQLEQGVEWKLELELGWSMWVSYLPMQEYVPGYLGSAQAAKQQP